MGKLFVIEGTDSSGKQTQLEKLKNSDIVIDRETLELIRIFS